MFSITGPSMIVLTAVVFAAACSSSRIDPPTSADCAAYAGVWRYDVEGQEGLMIVSGNYAIGLMTTVGRPQLGEAPTEAALAGAFETANAFAVQIRCEDDRVYNEVLYNLNPNAAGSAGVSANELSGNEIQWWMLAEDGSRGERLSATRVK